MYREIQKESFYEGLAHMIMEVSQSAILNPETQETGGIVLAHTLRSENQGSQWYKS